MTYDVIIVGLGAMGSAAADQLSRRGARVLGLEQFDIPHARGSSHGYSRMIRMAYYEHPDYVPLLRRAYELWYDLERRSGQKLLHVTGGLYMDKPEGHVVAGALAAAKLQSLPHELLDGAAISRRFPQFSLPADYVGVLEPQAGFLLPEKVIAAQAIEAMKHGAELRAHEPAVEWSSTDAGVRVRTERGEYRGKHVLFCGGAWTDRLVRDLGVPLKVTRQVLGWVWPREYEQFRLGTFPVWGVHHPDGSLSYGFPMTPDNPGLKLARHGLGEVVDPESVARDATPRDREEVEEIARRFIPAAAGGDITAIRICLYTNSPDGHFILGPHPRHPNVTPACGFSGHGFKFTSVVGEVLADLATKGKAEHPIGFLSPHRFG